MSQFQPIGNEQDTEESASTMPLTGLSDGVGMGAEPGFEVGPVEQGGSLALQTTIIIALAAVIMAGAIFGMRAMQADLTLDPTARKTEAQIEGWLSKLERPELVANSDPTRPENINELFDDTESVVAMLDFNPAQRQVPVEYLKKNPFDLVLPKTQTKAAADTGDDQAKKREELIRSLKARLRSLKLQSVMGGPRPVAVIDGEFCRPGAKVGGFTIRTIKPQSQSVVLEADGFAFELRMASGQ